MINAVDTFYEYVKGRMASINPSRGFAGYMDALAWPPNPLQFETLYLLQISDDPVTEEASSEAVQIYEQNLQWQWVVKGTETSNYTDVEGRNRGNRARIAWQMKEELRKSMWPGFTQKQERTVENNQLVVTTLNEPIIWQRPQFRIRSDKESGLVYGIAIVKIINMTELIEA